MILPEKAPGIRFAKMYLALARSILDPSQEANAEILDDMQRFMRDELLPDTDPNEAFYFHLWYNILRNTGATEVNINTVVSIAHKRLQRRADRIDDAEIKRAFLTGPLWNRSLRLAAKEYKIV